jgi:hypothetical protein
VGYAGYLLRHDLFWTFLLGAGLGGVVATATVVPSRHPDPERVRSRKWTVAPLWGALIIIAATGGILAVGLDQFRYPAWLIVGLISLIVVAIGVRFPRAAGLPIVLVVAVAATLFSWSLRGWTPIRSPTQIGTMRVLSVGPDHSIIETRESELSVPGVLELTGDQAVAIIPSMELSRYLFFSGAERWIHVSGDPRGYVHCPDAAPAGFSPAGLLGLLERPGGARFSVAQSNIQQLRLLRGYRISVLEDGSVQIRDQRLGE